MYNAAEFEIYAFKPDYLLRKGNTDADINYAMQAGKLLGASHVTLELPEDPAHTLKLGQLAKKMGLKSPITDTSNNMPTGGMLPWSIPS